MPSGIDNMPSTAGIELDGDQVEARHASAATFELEIYRFYIILLQKLYGFTYYVQRWLARAGQDQRWPTLACLVQVWPATVGQSKCWPTLACLGQVWSAKASVGQPRATDLFDLLAVLDLVHEFHLCPAEVRGASVLGWCPKFPGPGPRELLEHRRAVPELCRSPCYNTL